MTGDGDLLVLSLCASELMGASHSMVSHSYAGLGSHRYVSSWQVPLSQLGKLRTSNLPQVEELRGGKGSFHEGD